MYVDTSASDKGTISTITGAGTVIPPSVSLALSKADLKSDPATPGNIATTSTDVTVKISNASNYNLALSIVGSTDIRAEGSNTIIKAGTVITDNTWGYKWDSDSSYTAPSTTAKPLTVPNLSNNGVSFTKTLTFGAKFASNADAGHYKASGTLSLTATPKITTSYTLADLTQMQQLTLAPDACANTPYLSGQTYSAAYNLTDVRDGNTYTVRKFGDGKCWMTQNLKLHNLVDNNSVTYGHGRLLIPSTSDIESNWNLQWSSQSGFKDNTANNMYYDTSKDTAYYSWCAATAGSAGGCKNPLDNTIDNPTTPISSGEAAWSICPKGWKLPSGGTSGDTDFYNLFKNMNLNISNNLATFGNIDWQGNDLATVQGSPYNFTYTNFMIDNSTGDSSNSAASWWSRTANGSIGAFNLYFSASYILPGSNANARLYGLAIRCVAE